MDQSTTDCSLLQFPWASSAQVDGQMEIFTAADCKGDLWSLSFLKIIFNCRNCTLTWRTLSVVIWVDRVYWENWLDLRWNNTNWEQEWRSIELLAVRISHSRYGRWREEGDWGMSLYSQLNRCIVIRPCSFERRVINWIVRSREELHWRNMIRGKTLNPLSLVIRWGGLLDPATTASYLKG